MIMAVSLFTYSCDSNNSNGDMNPPELPSVETMSFDFSEMQSSQSKAKSGSRNNFQAGLYSAAYTKLILDVSLMVPKVLVAAAQNHDPEQISDNEWEWEYATQTDTSNFSVRLTAATSSNSDVTWNFFVTNSETGFDNELLFVGNSDYEATSGTWTYYDVQTGSEAFTVTWNRAENDETVTLEIKSDSHENDGDTIAYTFDGTVKTVVFTDSSSGETTTISFNTETHTGFVISPEYNNGEKACWDEDLNDITCAE